MGVDGCHVHAAGADIDRAGRCHFGQVRVAIDNFDRGAGGKRGKVPSSGADLASSRGKGKSSGGGAGDFEFAVLRGDNLAGVLPLGLGEAGNEGEHHQQ